MQTCTTSALGIGSRPDVVSGISYVSTTFCEMVVWLLLSFLRLQCRILRTKCNSCISVVKGKGKGKGKGQAPWGCRRFRLPESLDTWHMKLAMLSAIRTACLNPQEIPLILISDRRWVDALAIVRPEGISQSKIPWHNIDLNQIFSDL
jgi:hypothetical protein